MNELEMTKAFAKLDNVNLHYEGNIICTENLYSRNGKYNPITDLALNCAARDKYNVQKVHSMVEDDKIIIAIRGFSEVVSIFNKEDISKASIECILKSEGLWK